MISVVTYIQNERQVNKQHKRMKCKHNTEKYSKQQISVIGSTVQFVQTKHLYMISGENRNHPQEISK